MIRRLRIMWLRARRAIALAELRRIRHSGAPLTTETARAIALQIEGYEAAIDRLTVGLSIEMFCRAPLPPNSTLPIGAEAAWASSGSAMSIARVPEPRPSAESMVFRSVLVGLALLFLALIVVHLSPQVAAQLWGAR